VAGESKRLKRILAILGCAVPLWAQYAGPAILSRGDAPAAMTNPQISFRPFVEITGVYDTGLAGVGLNSQGELGNSSSPGIQLGWGISGSHSWRHTQVGLDYRGDIRDYTRTTYYDTTDQSLLLGVKHQITRHIMINWRNSVGMFSTNFGTLGLPDTVPFDPSQSFIPTTDFFDNRTIYGSSMVDLIIQRSARLSFDLGGGGFFARRRSSALYGVTGATAKADVQYRLTRYTTIGAEYTYDHFSFNHLFNSTDIQGAEATYAVQLTKDTEFTGYAGVMRVETKFIQATPLDPVIAAILGITQAVQVSYGVRYVPNVSARLSRALQHGVIYLDGGHTVTPGNGLFLTSTMSEVGGGYTYTGLRRWSFNVGGGWDRAKSIGNIQGDYAGSTGTIAVSRQVTRAVHVVASFSARNYSSADFAMYNRVIYDMQLGLGFAPGDVPIRIW